MKKISVIILAGLTVLALALVGCDTDNTGGTDGGGNTNGNGRTYAKALWGEWLRMDTGDKWYISNNALKVNGASAPTSAVLTKQSDRVIEVTDGGRKYYLYASRTATASFTGVIVGNAGAGSARAVGGGLGGVRVAIENLVNKANELTTDTDADGKFIAEGVILGDAYKLTPEGGTSVTVIPTSEGDDIGVIAITSGVNFKTSLTPAQSSADMTELYINETYQFDLEFENTGDEDCPAPSYTIAAPSGVSITGNLQDILGTIEPGVKKSVPISVRCYTVAGDYEYKKINVTIRDGTGKTWEDSVSLRFYKETLDFTIKAERPVSGIVISPDSKTYSFTDVTDGRVSAPRRTAGDYLVVFSGATIETETSYSLGVGVEADGDFGEFFDTSRYEPNNREGAAVALDTQKVMAYLYKNDIDYYRVSYSNIDVPSRPTGVSASAADAEVTISWNAVAGATSYNVYRSGSQTGTYTKVGASTTASYTDTVASVGTYYYKVSAVSAGGVESVYSAPTEIMVTIAIDVTALSETLLWLSANAVASGHYILSLTRNETIPPQTLSYSDMDITIMLKGKGGERTVSLEGNGSLFTVESGVTLALEDGVTLKGHNSNNASLVRVNSGGNLVLKDGGEISGNTASVSYPGYSYGGGVYTASGGTFTMSGGTISGNTAASRGGGVYVNRGTFTQSGGTISGNTAPLGGGVYVEGGTLTQNGGTISGNTASATGSNSYSYGGGVYVEGGGTLTQNGGTISGNTASAAGSSSSYAHGGGVFVYYGMLTQSGGTISGNTASATGSNSYSYGGGVSVRNGTFTMSGGEISGNTATTDGGGVEVSSGTFTLIDGTISGNTASDGGGVFVRSSGTFTMSGGTISGNTAATNGGGVYVSSSTFMMSGGEISDNSATRGGGVYVSSSGTFTKQSGGIIYGSDADAGLKNTATSGDSYGHAVYTGSKRRNTTAGVGVTLDSAKSGAAGGWE